MNAGSFTRYPSPSPIAAFSTLDSAGRAHSSRETATSLNHLINENKRLKKIVVHNKNMYERENEDQNLRLSELENENEML